MSVTEWGYGNPKENGSYIAAWHEGGVVRVGELYFRAARNHPAMIVGSWYSADVSSLVSGVYAWMLMPAPPGPGGGENSCGEYPNVGDDLGRLINGVVAELRARVEMFIAETDKRLTRLEGCDRSAGRRTTDGR